MANAQDPETPRTVFICRRGATREKLRTLQVQVPEPLFLQYAEVMRAQEIGVREAFLQFMREQIRAGGLTPIDDPAWTGSRG